MQVNPLKKKKFPWESLIKIWTFAFALEWHSFSDDLGQNILNHTPPTVSLLGTRSTKIKPRPLINIPFQLEIHHYIEKKSAASSSSRGLLTLCILCTVLNWHCSVIIQIRIHTHLLLCTEKTNKLWLVTFPVGRLLASLQTGPDFMPILKSLAVQKSY